MQKISKVLSTSRSVSSNIHFVHKQNLEKYWYIVESFAIQLFLFSDDDTSPMHYTELESRDGKANYTVSYPSYHYGHRDIMKVMMTVRVFVPWIPYISRKEIAYDQIEYHITKSLNGRIRVTQPNRDIKYINSRAVVSTLNMTKLEVNFHDPNGKTIFAFFVIELSDFY